MMRTRAVWPPRRPFLRISQRKGPTTARSNARCILAIHWISWRKKLSGAYGNAFNNSSECFVYRGFNFRFWDLEVEEMFW
jgi:hypothetical protein